MDLNFELFETATLFITVLVVAFMLQVRDYCCLLPSTKRSSCMLVLAFSSFNLLVPQLKI